MNQKLKLAKVQQADHVLKAMILGNIKNDRTWKEGRKTKSGRKSLLPS